MTRHTLSFCPTCYMEIPATIEGVTMHKVCPVHGEFMAQMERNEKFYLSTMQHPTGIYGGHFVDVTERCNMKCDYCYFPVGANDIDRNLILNECRVNVGPYVLTGGEPTLRDDLIDIIRDIPGPCHVITNGSRLHDRNYLKELAGNVQSDQFCQYINLSMHKHQAVFDAAIENAKALGVVYSSVLFVIDALEQIDDIVEFSEANKGICGMVRIKAASNVWAQGGTSKIFVSDILDYMQRFGSVRVYPGSKAVYAPFMVNGVSYAAVSWHDVGNVDLLDINCPPTYRAKNGERCDLIKAFIINEGMSKGWLYGAPCPSC